MYYFTKVNTKMKGIYFILNAFSLTLFLNAIGFAQASSISGKDFLVQETVKEVKSKLTIALDKYCGEACQVLGVDIKVDEALPENMDLGFESLDPKTASDYFVESITANIQIDNRVTTINKERLQAILNNYLSTLGHQINISWRSVEIPQIGKSLTIETKLRKALRQKIEERIGNVLDSYCPEDCVLSKVAIDGSVVTADQAQGVSATETFRISGNDGIFKIDNVDVELSVDTDVPAGERNQISNLIKANLRWVSPVNLDQIVTEFPDSYAVKKAKEQDPYGLNKLRETLQIFRELGGTKEIISKESKFLSNETSSTETMSSSSSEKSLASNSNNNSSTDSSSSSESQSFLGQMLGEYWWAYLLGAGLLLILALTFSQRYSNAKKDADMMVNVARMPQSAGGLEPGLGQITGAEGASAPSGAELDQELSLRLQIQKLRDELSKFFLDNPKVAKETFGRILQDEGIEQTARYVHIFGRGVVFELLGDPNFQRDLTELTEYYGKTDFKFDFEEELELLTRLKTKVTANEIRVLARKTMHVFDFLFRMDAGQLYNLIVDEKPQVQSIVLTQLDLKRRKAVFDMFEGEGKVALLKELCRAEAFPKDYLNTVAQALKHKVTSRPEFDTHNLRTTDILYDLLEKSDLSEQKALMQNLSETNPEAARGIKMRLITLEVIPYLRDGQILELVLGLERDDLMTFLRGTLEHIRNLLFSKVPEELAESWQEDLMNVSGVDEERYRMVELKILGKVRSLAGKGAINLKAINDMIFSDAYDAETEIDAPDLPRESYVA